MQPTRDHDEIRDWAERHGAVPAEVRPIRFDGEPSVLYFLMDSAREGTPELHPIEWEDFFARFDLLELSLAYEEGTSQFQILQVEPRGQVLAFN